MTREADQYAKKLLVVVPDATAAYPERGNHVWSYNFVSGRTQDGRTIRMLTLIDEYSRSDGAVRLYRRWSSWTPSATNVDLYASRTTYDLQRSR